MTRPDYCELAVLLDRSGSMQSIKSDIEGGFDRFIEEQRGEPGVCRVTLTQFDSQSIEVVYTGRLVAEVPKLTLVPRASTPLLDAVGRTIVGLGHRLAAMTEAARPARVLVAIVTDGQENSSHEYTKARIREMITHQHDVYKWEFIYLGANVDAFAEAGGMGIAADMATPYDATPTGVREVFSRFDSSVKSFRKGGSAKLEPRGRPGSGS